MVSIYSITNQKGGVGKTTTCVNLAASLAATKRKVLLIDLDPQGNATMGSGVNKYELTYSSYHLLTQKVAITDTVIKQTSAGYDLIPANADLTAAEVELMKKPSREIKLRQALKKIEEQYDFIFIDCPPSLNMLTLNSLVASKGVIIPMQCEYYALEGLSALISTISGLNQTLNPDLHIQGILRTMYDGRTALTTEVSKQLINHFGNKVYRTVIPRNIKLAEAPSHGVPALHYAKKSRGAVAYIALAGEIIRRQEKNRKIPKRKQLKSGIVKKSNKQPLSRTSTTLETEH
ncbi:MAG: ParA family protein [Endozoicomonadaceae bacterium]|nr:ParA family protein [Endozoicomonadaceae bacterium]MCY4328980.1 ParA family protein [Endozoicomonadaceae bacterium]